MIIDYGHDAATLYSASHATGTLTTYRGHAAERREEGPGWLLEPGERDITSHVNLTGIALAARDAACACLAPSTRPTSCSASASPSGSQTTTAGRPAHSRDAWR